MTIHPKALNLLRVEQNKTQKQLADEARVSLKTINRLEKGEAPRRTNGDTVARLARALSVKPEALAVAPRDSSRRESEAWLRKRGYRRVSHYVDAKTTLSFDLVERRYGVPPKALIDAAPLFATLLFEMSLKERRHRLEEWKERYETALREAPTHLLRAWMASSDLEEAEEDERGSLRARDVSGSAIEDDGWAGKEDLFVKFLGRLADECPEGGVELIMGTAKDLHYDVVLGDDLNEVASGDSWAKFALREGHVRLREIPAELWDADRAEDRARWLAAKVPDEARQDHENFLAQIDVDLDVDEAAAPATKAGGPSDAQ